MKKLLIAGIIILSSISISNTCHSSAVAASKQEWSWDVFVLEFENYPERNHYVGEHKTNK